MQNFVKVNFLEAAEKHNFSVCIEIEKWREKMEYIELQNCN